LLIEMAYARSVVVNASVIGTLPFKLVTQVNQA